MSELVEALQVPREYLFLHGPDPSLWSTAQERQEQTVPEESIGTKMPMSPAGDEKARTHVCPADDCGRSYLSHEILATHMRQDL